VTVIEQKFRHLRQHYLICHEEKQFECPKCGSRFHEQIPLKSHLKICGKLKCETCGSSYKGTQGLEKHILLKKGFHQPTAEAAEILRLKRSRTLPKMAPSCGTVNRRRRLLPKAAEVATVATQTERNDQATQVCHQVAEEAEAAVATQYDTMWHESRNSWCQTSTSQFFDAAGMYLGCPPQESVPVQTDPYFGATQCDLATQCTGRDMNCQTDSFDFYDFESAGTQTDLFDDFLTDALSAASQSSNLT
jgi:hypothetical protein